MKKVLLGLLVLIILVVAGGALYVASIDWNQHKDKIAQQFQEMTGKKIVFAGPVSLQFLPSPNLTAEQVKIFNPGAQEPLVEVQNLVANLALMPLLEGKVDVKRMVLENPQINVEVDDNGTLNWQQEMSSEERSALEQAEITLNSVSLQNATLNFEMPSMNISRQLTNLNGEIMAQSILGPYRVEGNYITDKNPEGFALSVGKLSDSFSTTLNLVVTHPSSESYIRFDGSFLLSNKVLNGNMIIESKKLIEFMKVNFKNMELPEAYEYPLALTFDINANEQQLNLSNMVIKYGETQGAGNIQIPLNDGLFDDEDSIKPRVDMAFNFTDFNLDPVAFTVKDFFNKYRNKTQPYEPDFPFDMLLDVKSLKTTYNGQPVKSFETSLDVIDNVITVNNFTATLPGETDVKFKGNITAYEEEPFYNLEMSFNASDFLKMLNWLDINPTVSVASTYRKAMGNAKLSGTFNRIQVSPFVLTIDKSSLSGEAGIKWGQRPDIMVVLNADSINFDNYITPLTMEQQSQNWTQRMQYRFAKLGMVNDFDLQLNAKLDLAIYENMPFEKVDLRVNLLDGRMEVNQFRINSVANAAWDFSGVLKGFGKVPSFENLKYAVKTKDVGALINKLEFKAPDLDYKKLKNFESKGIATGSLERFATKTVSNLEDFEFAYVGQVIKQENGVNYTGMLEVKHPDFVRMVNELNLPYNPQVYSLGVFGLKTKFVGTGTQFKANPLDFNIGFNNFSGELSYDKTGERPNVLTTLSINKFELERFMNKAAVEANTAQPALAVNSNGGEAEFLTKPFWDKARIDYGFYQKFDLSGKFSVNELSYKQYILEAAVASVSLNDGTIDVSSLAGNYKNAPLQSRLSLNTKDKTSLSGALQLDGINVSDLGWSGTRYGLTEGKANLNLVANTTALSQDDIIKNLAGSFDLTVSQPKIKGWNLSTIYDDVIVRQVPEGLSALVKENLLSGATSFNQLQAKFDFKDGAFSLSNGQLSASGLTLTLFGDGNLASWDMNLLFNVKYEEPRWLPGYSFSLKGPINAPLVDVNVSALFNLYKSKIDKANADVKAQEVVEQDRLKALIDEQKKAAQVLLDELKNKQQPAAEKYLREATSDKALAALQAVQNSLNQLLPEIVENANNGDSVEISDDLIAQMAAENKRVTGELEKVKPLVMQAVLLDQKFVMKNTYEQLVEAYNQGKLLVFNFNTARDGFKSRLLKIKTTFNFDEDANIAGWQQFMDDKAALINDQNQQLMNQYMAMQKSVDEQAIRDYNMQLQNLKNQVQEDAAAINDSLDKYRVYGEEKVAKAEQDYADKLREQEVQRKVEENTGVINIKKTGKSVTVQRDIQEIEKSEELTSKEQVKVLDFSKPQVQKNSPQEVDDNVVKKGRVIRK